jgi:hypothetical protein
MNTIQITNNEGQVINYTETEVKLFIEKAAKTDETMELATRYSEKLNLWYNKVSDIRNEVYEFFSEGVWDGTESVVERDDVNRLLDKIGSRKLSSKFTGTFVVSARFEIEAEDEEDAVNIIRDNVTLSVDGDIDYEDEEVEVTDIEVYE